MSPPVLFESVLRFGVVFGAFCVLWCGADVEREVEGRVELVE